MQKSSEKNGKEPISGNLQPCDSLWIKPTLFFLSSTMVKGWWVGNGKDSVLWRLSFIMGSGAI